MLAKNAALRTMEKSALSSSSKQNNYEKNEREDSIKANSVYLVDEDTERDILEDEADRYCRHHPL
jgi:hypothetical protein